jgi:hypothetical protein
MKGTDPSKASPDLEFFVQLGEKASAEMFLNQVLVSGSNIPVPDERLRLGPAMASIEDMRGGELHVAIFISNISDAKTLDVLNGTFLKSHILQFELSSGNHNLTAELKPKVIEPVGYTNFLSDRVVNFVGTLSEKR